MRPVASYEKEREGYNRILERGRGREGVRERGREEERERGRERDREIERKRERKRGGRREGAREIIYWRKFYHEVPSRGP